MGYCIYRIRASICRIWLSYFPRKLFMRRLFRSDLTAVFQITLFVIGAIAGAATAYLLLQTHAQLALFLVLVSVPICLPTRTIN